MSDPWLRLADGAANPYTKLVRVSDPKRSVFKSLTLAATLETSPNRSRLLLVKGIAQISALAVAPLVGQGLAFEKVGDLLTARFGSETLTSFVRALERLGWGCATACSFQQNFLS